MINEGELGQGIDYVSDSENSVKSGIGMTIDVPTCRVGQLRSLTTTDSNNDNEDGVVCTEDDHLQSLEVLSEESRTPVMRHVSSEHVSDSKRSESCI